MSNSIVTRIHDNLERLQVELAHWPTPDRKNELISAIEDHKLLLKLAREKFGRTEIDIEHDADHPDFADYLLPSGKWTLSKAS
jgi:hypothetical protein